MEWNLINEHYGVKFYVSVCGKYAKKECYVYGELRTVIYRLNKCGDKI